MTELFHFTLEESFLAFFSAALVPIAIGMFLFIKEKKKNADCRKQLYEAFVQRELCFGNFIVRSIII